MNYFDIKNNTKADLCNGFYITQAVYLFTDLSMGDGRGGMLYPNKAKLVNDMNKKIGQELIELGIIIEKAMPPKKDPNAPEFLNTFSQQNSLQLLLVCDDEVIQPPKNLGSLMTAFEMRVIPLPWN